MKNNTYMIRNVKDMLMVVKPESLDCFLQDLRYVFELYYESNNLQEEFEWIDDGKNDININYKCDNPKKQTGIPYKDKDEDWGPTISFKNRNLISGEMRLKHRLYTKDDEDHAYKMMMSGNY